MTHHYRLQYQVWLLYIFTTVRRSEDHFRLLPILRFTVTELIRSIHLAVPVSAHLDNPHFTPQGAPYTPIDIVRTIPIKYARRQSVVRLAYNTLFPLARLQPVVICHHKKSDKPTLQTCRVFSQFLVFDPLGLTISQFLVLHFPV